MNVRMSLVLLLLCAGCDSLDEAPDEAALIAEVEPEPPTPAVAPSPVPLDVGGQTLWQTLHDADAATPQAPDWPVVTNRLPENGAPWLRARAWYVVDEDTGKVVSAKNADKPLPIASITKLATAMIWADADVAEDREMRLTQADKEFMQVTRSRLRVGGTYRVHDLYYSALLASDNRAALLLAKSTDLPLPAFIAATNRRMKALGLDSIVIDDPTGLSDANVATARDVARLLAVAAAHPVVGPSLQVMEHRYRRVDRSVWILARQSNLLAHMDHWTVRGAKTGFTNLAGSCLVVRTTIAGRNVTAAFLGARGIDTRYGDAGRLRAWMEVKQAESEGETADQGG